MSQIKRKLQAIYDEIDVYRQQVEPITGKWEVMLDCIPNSRFRYHLIHFGELEQPIRPDEVK